MVSMWRKIVCLGILVFAVVGLIKIFKEEQIHLYLAPIPSNDTGPLVDIVNPVNDTIVPLHFLDPGQLKLSVNVVGQRIYEFERHIKIGLIELIHNVSVLGHRLFGLVVNGVKKQIPRFWDSMKNQKLILH
jgi:hypothetical protein